MVEMLRLGLFKTGIEKRGSWSSTSSESKHQKLRLCGYCARGAPDRSSSWSLSRGETFPVVRSLASLWQTDRLVMPFRHVQGREKVQGSWVRVWWSVSLLFDSHLCYVLCCLVWDFVGRIVYFDWFKCNVIFSNLWFLVYFPLLLYFRHFSFIFVNFLFSLCVSLFSNELPRFHGCTWWRSLQTHASFNFNFKNNRRNKVFILTLLLHGLSAIEIPRTTRRHRAPGGANIISYCARTLQSFVFHYEQKLNLISSNKRDWLKENSPGSILFHRPIYFAPQILSV